MFVAHQAFETALEMLEEGCAAQDAQATSTSGYPGVGLHLHRARVLAVMGDTEHAIDELTRELDAPHNGHVYTRDCNANTWYALGALRHRQGRRSDATAAFNQALMVLPGHWSTTAALGGDPSSARRRQDPHTN